MGSRHDTTIERPVSRNDGVDTCRQYPEFKGWNICCLEAF